MEGGPLAERITSLQVAKLAGVSQSAVSRVFTPGASASSKTALKVREAAIKLGYRPNVLARSLITGKSRIIGLIVAYLDNYFYPLALEKLSNSLQSEGYHVLVFMASNDTKSTDQVIDELLDYQVEGIITASVGLSTDLTVRCEAAGVPVVLFNRSLDVTNHSAVTSNNFSGGKSVAEFFVAAGHKRIGYIGGWEGASTQREREAGFRSALAEAGETLAAHALGQFTVEGAKKLHARCLANLITQTQYLSLQTTWHLPLWMCCVVNWVYTCLMMSVLLAMMMYRQHHGRLMILQPCANVPT